ncbi:PAS domain-containing protein [Streptomyces sp. NBC_01617]|uniref:PAS domain-containing protein n=1 Tax=Streptomyces sp. NBC_01617 TaxID=2975899 RepID=UPI00386DF3D2
MTEPEIDYAAVFRALPGAVALLTPQLLYVDANDGFLGMRDRTREQVIGHHLTADVSDPNDPAGPLVDNLQASLRPNMSLGLRPPSPSPRATSSCCTPTA